jgi:site-specific recombinase XerD
MTDVKQLPLFYSTEVHKYTYLKDSIEHFQKYLRNEGKTLNTLKGFTSDLHLMCQYFGEETSVGLLTTPDLNRYLDWLEHGRGQVCSQKSYARRVTTLKVFFKWLESTKVRQDNPAKPVLQRSGPAPLQSILFTRDINILLDYTYQLRFAKKPDPRPDLLVHLLLDSGIKKSECMNLRPEHIERDDPKHPMLLIRHKERINIYKERRIPLDSSLLDVLDEYLVQYRPKEFIFECTPRNLEYVLTDTGIAAGVEGRISFEILRWTSAVRDYLHGMDMEALREKMGLSRISWRETSAKVVQLANQQLARQ